VSADGDAVAVRPYGLTTNALAVGTVILIVGVVVVPSAVIVPDVYEPEFVTASPFDAAAVVAFVVLAANATEDIAVVITTAMPSAKNFFVIFITFSSLNR
jgi:hypothetical protein